jgi:hypothetical protein
MQRKQQPLPHPNTKYHHKPNSTVNKYRHKPNSTVNKYRHKPNSTVNKYRHKPNSTFNKYYYRPNYYSGFNRNYWRPIYIPTFYTGVYDSDVILLNSCLNIMNDDMKNIILNDDNMEEKSKDEIVKINISKCLDQFILNDKLYLLESHPSLLYAYNIYIS